jgi:hypothetical protein
MFLFADVEFTFESRRTLHRNEELVLLEARDVGLESEQNAVGTLGNLG